VVVVTYAPAHVDDFIRVADELEDAFPGLIVEGVEDVEREGVSVLEVSLGGGARQEFETNELTDAAGIARIVDYCRRRMS